MLILAHLSCLTRTIPVPDDLESYSSITSPLEALLEEEGSLNEENVKHTFRRESPYEEVATEVNQYDTYKDFVQDINNLSKRQTGNKKRNKKIAENDEQYRQFQQYVESEPYQHYGGGENSQYLPLEHRGEMQYVPVEAGGRYETEKPPYIPLRERAKAISEANKRRGRIRFQDTVTQKEVDHNRISRKYEDNGEQYQIPKEQQYQSLQDSGNQYELPRAEGLPENYPQQQQSFYLDAPEKKEFAYTYVPEEASSGQYYQPSGFPLESTAGFRSETIYEDNEAEEYAKTAGAQDIQLKQPKQRGRTKSKSAVLSTTTEEYFQPSKPTTKVRRVKVKKVKSTPTPSPALPNLQYSYETSFSLPAGADLLQNHQHLQETVPRQAVPEIKAVASPELSYNEKVLKAKTSTKAVTQNSAHFNWFEAKLPGILKALGQVLKEKLFPHVMFKFDGR